MPAVVLSHALYLFSFSLFLPGAVISARHFRHPVSIARKIMDESPHCALSGEGALEFALSLGNFNEICAPNDLKGDDCPNQIRLNISQPEYGGQAHLVYVGQATDTQDSDTVSAVAMDVNGYLACANSTGSTIIHIQLKHIKHVILHQSFIFLQVRIIRVQVRSGIPRSMPHQFTIARASCSKPV